MKTCPRVWDRLLRVSKTSPKFWSMVRPYIPVAGMLDPPLSTWLGHWTLLGKFLRPLFCHPKQFPMAIIRPCLSLSSTKFKTQFYYGKCCTAVTTIPTADNNIVYIESVERQLPTEQTVTVSNCETTESRTENRTSSPPSSDRDCRWISPIHKTIGAHHIRVIARVKCVKYFNIDNRPN